MGSATLFLTLARKADAPPYGLVVPTVPFASAPFFLLHDERSTMALQLVGRIFRLDRVAACKRVVSLRVARRAAWVALFLVVLGLNG